MRLLIDQNLPRRLASVLKANGYDAVHTEDVDLAVAQDPEVLAWCCTHGSILVTADKKLTKFLASSAADCPSVLILREMRTLSSDDLALTLMANLPDVGQVIDERGNAVFSFAPPKPIRAELLPLGLADKAP